MAPVSVPRRNGGVQFDANWRQLTGEQAGQPLRIHAIRHGRERQRGALHRALALGKTFRICPRRKRSSHFTGVRRMDEKQISTGGATCRQRPKFPVSVDDAAVYYLRRRLMRVLRQQRPHQRAAAASSLAEELAAQARRVRTLARAAAERARSSQRRSGARSPTCRNFRFTAPAVGEGWALVPSAAGFVDPLLSTGFPLTLLGIHRLAAAIEQLWNPLRFRAELDHYAKQTLAELDATALLIAALYASMRDFEVFAALSLLYFAAASFSETARRLGRPELASSFLLQDHPHFGPELRACCHEPGATPGGALLG